VLDVQRIDKRFDEGYMVAWLTLFFAYFPLCLITAPSFGIFLLSLALGLFGMDLIIWHWLLECTIHACLMLASQGEIERQNERKIKSCCIVFYVE